MAFRPADKAHLYNEFAKLLQAGFGIDKAAATILDQDPRGGQRTFAEGIASGVKGGSSIAGAVRALPLPVSDLEVDIISAGEQGGRLEDAFAHLANYYAMLVRTASQVRSRLVYPAILLHMAVILPALPKAISTRSGGTGFVTAVLLQLAILYAVVAVLAVAWRTLAKSARTSAPIDRLLNRIPLVGPARRSLALARFARVFEIFLLSGQRVSEGAGAAGRAAQSGTLLAASRAAEQAAREGNPVGPVLLADPAVPRGMARSLASAEEAGTLEKDLHRWAVLQEQNASDALEKLGEWTPKVIYILAVIFVAWQIIDLFTNFYLRPYGDMIDQLDAL